MQSRLVDIAGRLRIRVYEGGAGPPLLFLHGAGGLLANDPFLARLERHYRVTAPLLPGYEDSDGSEHLRTMLDFTLFGLDCMDAFGLEDPIVVGHSMGGMIAAEMAATANRSISRLVLVGAAGLWIEEQPTPDLFALLPYDVPAMLFHDPARHGALLSAGGDLNDPEFLTEFLVGNARRLGTAGKILFPIPERGLAERLYRVRARTRIVWGASDQLIPPAYGRAFQSLIAGSELDIVPDAGHMVIYEAPDAVLASIARLHN